MRAAMEGFLIVQIWAHTGGGIYAWYQPTAKITSADLLFCDAENGDYTLDACSPCLPGNHPDGVDCGLIGAPR